MQPDTPPPRRRRRVPALAPEERRAAIIAATIPLLREHGPAVTTKQIAEAAGVAEGTVFSVFTDKQSLIQAVVLNAMNPAGTERQLAEIDPGLEVHACLMDIVRILTRRFADTSAVFISMRRKADERHQHGLAPHGPPPKAFMAELGRVQQRTLAAVSAAIEPHHAELRLPPMVVAKMLLAVMTMASHPGAGYLDDVAPSTIVSVLLDGALLPEQKPTADSTPATEDSTSC